jgi:hypothetical protein
MEYRRFLAQEFCEALDVAIILPERILKPVFAAIDALAPGIIVFSAENPPLHVLGFDDENSKDGYQYMVYLGGAILGGKNDIVDARINGRIQTNPDSESCQFFPNPTLAGTVIEEEFE